MKKNSNKLKPILIKWGNFIIAVSLLLVIVISGLFIFFSQREAVNSNSNESENPSELLTRGFGSLITIGNSKKLDIVGKTVNLNENLNFVAGFRDLTSNNDYFCKDIDQKECQMYIISDSNFSIYLSSPTALSSKVSVQTSDERKNLKVGSKSFEFTFAKVKNYNLDSEGNLTEIKESNLYKEIYGCFENICFSSGILNFENAEINNKQRELFENYLNLISF